MADPIGTAAQQDLDGAQNEGVYSMYEEVVAEIALLKKRPPSDAKDISFLLIRTVLPLIRDLAHYARENRQDIDSIMDELDENDEERAAALGTQFAKEDAPKYDLVLQFAQGVASEMLQRPELPEEERAKVQLVLTTAEECLKQVEELTILEDEEPEPSEQPS